MSTLKLTILRESLRCLTCSTLAPPTAKSCISILLSVFARWRSKPDMLKSMGLYGKTISSSTPQTVQVTNIENKGWIVPDKHYRQQQTVLQYHFRYPLVGAPNQTWPHLMEQGSHRILSNYRESHGWNVQRQSSLMNVCVSTTPTRPCPIMPHSSTTYGWVHVYVWVTNKLTISVTWHYSCNSRLCTVWIRRCIDRTTRCVINVIVQLSSGSCMQGIINGRQRLATTRGR